MEVDELGVGTAGAGCRRSAGALLCGHIVDAKQVATALLWKITALLERKDAGMIEKQLAIFFGG